MSPFKFKPISPSNKWLLYFLKLFYFLLQEKICKISVNLSSVESHNIECNVPLFSGMIEQSHCTLEGIIKKVMHTQQDWEEILDSALLGMRLQVHASTRYLPIRMLFNINPVLPFQMTDKLKYSNLSELIENDCNESSEIGQLI